MSVLDTLPALALALALSDGGPSGAGGLDAPGPRVAVGGIETITFESRVVFAAAPERPHRVRASLAFPGRARLELRVEGGTEGQRTLTWCYGDRFYELASGADRSRELTGAAREAVADELALRVALLLWPDANVWTLEGSRAVAPLGDGSLRAELVDGRPRSLSRLDAEGAERAHLAAIDWAAALEPGARRWPARFELWSGGKLVWREELLTVDTAGRFVDGYFLPPDRRALEGAATVRRAPPRAARLPARTERRFPLAEGTTWQQALAAAEDRAREIESSEPDVALDPARCFELDAAGRPRALLLRLTEASGRLPEGWVRRPESRGWTVFVDVVPADLEAGLVALRAAAKERDGDPPRGAAYVRLDPAAPSRGQLVLPDAER